MEIEIVYKYYQYSLISLLLSLGLFSQTVMAVMITQGPYNGTDAGGLDLVIAQGAKLGNPTNEAAWVNSVLTGPDVTFEVKTETVAYYETEVADVYALLLQSAPGYYLIKNAQRVALLQNNPSMEWGVFDLADLDPDLKLSTDDLYISHVTEFNGSTQLVPEPSTLALLGLGLIGVFVSKRRHSTHTA
jgi:hypothetical protein